MEKGSGTYSALDMVAPCILLPATARRTTAVPLSSTGNGATEDRKNVKMSEKEKKIVT